MEQWKMIENFQGYYMISNYGGVWSLPRAIKTKNGQTRELKGKLLSYTTHGTGYNNVYLSKNGVKTYVGVHRLVAIHFVDNPQNKEIVNHKNEIRNDNHYLNLEWVTHGENLAHNGAFQKGREKIKKKVYQYSLDGELINVYSYAGATAEDGFTPNAVTQVCCGFKGSHKGYHWRYEERK